jgi:transposase
MGAMIQRVVEIAGNPIIKQIKKELVEESFIHFDETPITVLQEGKKGSRQGDLWVYRSKSKVLFNFRSDRERDGPSAFLKDLAGTLQTDGDASDNEIVVRNGLNRAGRWSHT